MTFTADREKAKLNYCSFYAKVGRIFAFAVKSRVFKLSFLCCIDLHT